MKYRIVIKWLKTDELSVKYFNSFEAMNIFSHILNALKIMALIRYVAQGYKESGKPILYGCNCFADTRRLLCGIEWGILPQITDNKM